MTDYQENLLAAYFEGQLTEQEKQEVLDLLRNDSDFCARFREMEEAYAVANMPAFEKTKAEDYRRLVRRMGGRVLSVSFWKPFAVAASVAAVVSLGVALYSGHQYRDAERFIGQAEVTTIAATRGTGTETVLPDGTRVCLNAGSSLQFGRGFGRGAREVSLEGEGYFEVAHDAANPFRVQAGNASVTVKGTVFNVRNYADEAEIAVSLLEGSVQLNSNAGEVTLRPGHCAVVSRESGKIRMSRADLTVADWTKGKIVFTDKSIPEILTYLERIYGVNFTYDPGLFKGERFTGNISQGLSIDDILTYIDIDHKYRWKRTDDTIEIQHK